MAHAAPALGPPRVAGGLDHVGLNVADLDEAVEFFVRQFGARPLFFLRPSAPVTQAGAGTATGSERLGAAPGAVFALAMLEIGAARLELLQWWGPRPLGRPPGPDQAGGAHVALEVPDVASALERLRRLPGVHVLGEPATFPPGETPGLTNAFVRTPWGLLVELVHWADDHEGTTPGPGPGGRGGK